MSMTRFVRIAGLAMAGSVSLVCGLLLAERLVQPVMLEHVTTAGLVGLVLLLFLPVLTYLALRQDARIAAHMRDLAAPVRGLEGLIEPLGAEPAELPDGPVRLVRHPAHDRVHHASPRRPAAADSPIATD